LGSEKKKNHDPSLTGGKIIKVQRSPEKTGLLSVQILLEL